jgi:hypothetical protein
MAGYKKGVRQAAPLQSWEAVRGSHSSAHQ